MKVVCLVNNYQYGETRFEKMRQQYAYQDEQLDDKHHVVFLDTDEETFKFLKHLLNAEHHNNVNKKSGFSERGWIELYRQRLHPKVEEDIEDDETYDDISEIPEQALHYISVAHDYNGDNFYIIWDRSRVNAALGLPEDADYDMAEEMYDLFFGQYNWGYDEYWTICDNCGLAMNTDDGDCEWLDSGCYCRDCITKNSWLADEYLEKCSREQFANYLLSESELTDYGWHLVCEEEWVNEDRFTFLRMEELERIHGGRFILNYEYRLGAGLYHLYSIWTDNDNVTPENLFGEEEEEEDGQSDN